MTDPNTDLFRNLTQDQLAGICDLARVLVSDTDHKAIRRTIASKVLTLLTAGYSSIQILEGQDDITVTLERREDSRDTEAARKCDQLIVGWVINNNSTLMSKDLASDDRFPFVAGDASCRSAILATPIRFRDDLVGVLIAARDPDESFSETNARLLELIADLASAALQNIRTLRRMSDEVRELKQQLVSQGRFGELVGKSPAWQNICATLNSVAPSEARVLVLGESGTGKELCARAIHDMSGRKEGPFVAVNCAALPESLAESELFGYVKGAFTGAAHDRDGLFSAADGGTLFLDEIGSASDQLQSSLLRAIQEGEIRPVGSTKPRSVDVRLVCATSGDLEEMVQRGVFRKDLYFRINVVTVPIPPLRDRREDIPILAREFLERHARRYDRKTSGVTPEALVVLETYSWPGNVRELENAMEHALLFTPAEISEIPLPALPQNILTASGLAASVSPNLGERGLDGLVAHYEKEIVRSALENCDWNQSQAARALKVPESRIRERIKRYDLRPQVEEGNTGRE